MRRDETANWCSEGREPWVVRESERLPEGVVLRGAPGACARMPGAHMCTGVWVCLCVHESVFRHLYISAYVDLDL